MRIAHHQISITLHEKLRIRKNKRVRKTYFPEQ